MSAPELLMYTRANCGLCERMREQIEAHIARSKIELKLMNIDGHAQLEKRFGERVPVLYFGDSELCFGRLDLDLLEEALADSR